MKKKILLFLIFIILCFFTTLCFLLTSKPTTEAMIIKYIIDPIPKSMKNVTWYKSGGMAGFHIRFRFTIDNEDLKKILKVHDFDNADFTDFKIPDDCKPDYKIYRSALGNCRARLGEIIYNENKSLVYYYYTRY